MSSEFGVFQVQSKRVVYCKLMKERNDFGGSKSLQCIVKDNKVVLVDRERRYNSKRKDEKEANEEVGNIVDKKDCLLGQIEDKSIDNELIDKPKRVYRLKKNEVINRCNAIFGLKESKKFMAFFTVSFPQGMTDNSIFKVWNTFLTRVRKAFNLKCYLWVAERQKNGTLHFHMVVNRYMSIRVVNGYMAISLRNELEKRPQEGVNFSGFAYNGVDVKRCDSNMKRLACYLTKYVSKNNEEFERLAWHCSRFVSALFTNYNTPYFSEVDGIFNGRFVVRRTIETEKATLLYLHDECIMKVIKLLNRVNEEVYKKFFEPEKPQNQPIEALKVVQGVLFIEN